MTTVNTAGIGYASFVHGSAAGPVSVPGLKVGDRVIWECIGVSPLEFALPGNYFESVISVDDEIQEAGGGNAGVTCAILFARGV